MTNSVNYDANPTIGQEKEVGTVTKVWDGEKWVNKSTGQHERRIGDLEKENYKASNIQELKDTAIDESWVGQTIEVKEYHENTGYGAGKWVVSLSGVADEVQIVQSNYDSNILFILSYKELSTTPESLGVKRDDASTFSRLENFVGKLLFSPVHSYAVANHDIDVSKQVWDGGGGATLDGTSITDVVGNYAVRFKNTGARNVTNIPYLSNGFNFTGFTIIGPDRDGDVIGMNFRSDGSGELGLGGLNIGPCTVGSFGVGHEYYTNAYIITHTGANILRCGKHVHMPLGGANYGENIKYTGGVISTSNGIGVHNVNPNGNIILVGTSLDYMGKIAFAERGGIYIVDGCHVEFDNGTNDLNDIPFEVGAAQDAHLVIKDCSRLLSYSGFTQTHLFKHAGNGSIVVDNNFIQKVVCSSGFLDTGDGDFVIKNTKTLEGSGNIEVSTLTTNNLAADGGFEQSNLPDVHITKDTSAITDRLVGSNMVLSIDSVNQRTGSQCLKATKNFGGGSAAAFVFSVPVDKYQQVGWRFYARVLSGGTPNPNPISVTSGFAGLLFRDQYGLPVWKKTQTISAATRELDNTDTSWTSVSMQLAKNKAPSWATHVLITVNMDSVNATELLIDDLTISTI